MGAICQPARFLCLKRDSKDCYLLNRSIFSFYRCSRLAVWSDALDYLFDLCLQLLNFLDILVIDTSHKYEPV